ncbi:hypothetical protein BZG72_11070 [Salinivibrio sp. PR6]|nr:hypothetical protein BZG20_10825 [Salinivibrio sp. IB868]OOE74478.1 hypothetical protein BZG22_08300 [Salinivibrio sp. IB870]OOE79190.1 hypothetical protein BZG25_09760 [Salinivibrio sp. ML198]OOE81401.1 hypothetical protein BZG72_11070 [Salinivibrio sp. PR6]
MRVFAHFLNVFVVHRIEFANLTEPSVRSSGLSLVAVASRVTIRASFGGQKFVLNQTSVSLCFEFAHCVMISPSL